MLFLPRCRNCLNELPGLAERARPGECCPDCMIATEEAAHPPLDFDYWNAPLDFQVLDTRRTGLNHDGNGRVVSVTFRVRARVSRECRYCGGAISVNRHVFCTVPEGRLASPASAIDAGVEHALSQIEFKESNAVYCDACGHFDPFAVRRHFSEGWGKYLSDVLTAAERDEALRKAESITLASIAAFALLAGTGGALVGRITMKMWWVPGVIAGLCGGLLGWWIGRFLANQFAGTSSGTGRWAEARTVLAGLGEEDLFRVAVHLYKVNEGSLSAIPTLKAIQQAITSVAKARG